MSNVHVLQDYKNSNPKILETQENSLRHISDSTDVLLDHMNQALQMIYPATQMIKTVECELEKPYKTFFPYAINPDEAPEANSEIESILSNLENDLEDFYFDYMEDNFIYKESLKVFNDFKNTIPYSITRYFYSCFVHVRFNRRSYDSLNVIEKKLNSFFKDLDQTFYNLKRDQESMLRDIDYIRSECIDFHEYSDDEIADEADGTFEGIQKILEMMENGEYELYPSYEEEKYQSYLDCIRIGNSSSSGYYSSFALDID